MALGLSALIYAQATPTTRQMTLTNGQVSEAPGKVVVTFEAKGDLRGLVTLTVNTSGNEITGGEWAFVVRYVEYLDHHGRPIPEGEEELVHNESEPHAERPVFVDKGTLSGPVGGGALSRDANGVITGLSSVLLSVGSGSLTFEGAAGHGSSAASGLDQAATSSGSLDLTF
jgi:hypothetical protein